jgi:hypothetical protein
MTLILIGTWLAAIMTLIVAAGGFAVWSDKRNDRSVRIVGAIAAVNLTVTGLVAVTHI